MKILPLRAQDALGLAHVEVNALSYYLTFRHLACRVFCVSSISKPRNVMRWMSEDLYAAFNLNYLLLGKAGKAGKEERKGCNDLTRSTLNPSSSNKSNSEVTAFATQATVTLPPINHTL